MSKEQVKFVCDAFYDITRKIKQVFGIKEKKSPSLLAENVAWFNNSSWLFRAIANGTIEDYKPKL